MMTDDSVIIPQPPDAADGSVTPVGKLPAIVADPADALVASVGALEKALRDLTAKFNARLSYDAHKEALFQKLHVELESYRNGQAARAALPMVERLISMDVRLDEREQSLRNRRPEDLGPDRVFRELATIRADLKLILIESGVEVFQESSNQFSDQRQLAEIVPTDDPAADNTISDRLRPGYLFGGVLLHRERVRVRSYQPSATPTHPVDPLPEPAVQLPPIEPTAD